MTEDVLRGRIAFDGTKTPLKTTLFLLVCVAWLLPGLIGHDPWKSDEAIAFGTVLEMLRTGDAVVFRIAGEPYMGRAPLYIWIAGGFAKAFGGILPLHDAARLASGLFMAGTLGFLSAASRELLGERAMRVSVLLFIGCLGLLIRAHEMTPDLAGLMGMALAMYGLALAARRAVVGGVLLGLGSGLAFLGDGFLPLGMMAVLVAVLPFAGPAWRTRQHAISVAVAVGVAAPLVGAWLLGLRAASPAWMQTWLQFATAWRGSDLFTREGIGDFFYFARILPWYAWPAWPLAAWTVWRARHALAARPGVMLPLVAFAVFLVVASLFAETRDVNAMPLLLPLVLLGVADIDSVPRGGASALDWFGVTTFSLIALVLWGGWIAVLTGHPESMLAWIRNEVPDFRYRFSFIAFVFASLFTLIWIVVVARSLRSTRRAIVNWTAGITMVWMLVMTLGVALVDQARSYRDISARLVLALPGNFTCVAVRNLGDPQRALLDYFVSMRTIRIEFPAASHCRVLLVQANPKNSDPVPSGWSEIWRGSRPGDRNEVFVLYRRS